MNIFEFDIPTSLNTIQLKQELQADSVYVLEDKLYIHGDLTKKKCEDALKNHVPKPSQDELNLQRKLDILAKLGLTPEEAEIILA